MPLTVEIKGKIEELFSKFVSSSDLKIRNLQISDLKINPFLTRLLSDKFEEPDSKKVIIWSIAQNIERSVVTSLGNTLKKISQLFSEDTVDKINIVRFKNDIRYHIKVANGPNTWNSSYAGARVNDIRNSLKNYSSAVGLVGLCYGDANEVSSVMKKEIEDKGGFGIIAGREFWRFISDVPSCFEDIFEIADEVSSSYFNTTGGTLQSVTDNKISELTEEFRRKYGGIRKIR